MMEPDLLTAFVPQLLGWMVSQDQCWPGETQLVSAGKDLGAPAWQCASFGRETQWVLHIFFTVCYRSGCKRSKLKKLSHRGTINRDCSCSTHFQGGDL